MSIAAHAARFTPQLALDLGPDEPAPAPRAEPLPVPTHGELVTAALANENVQAFIAERLPTWSEERVRRSPSCYLVYEHGEVVGSTADMVAMARLAEKRPGFGRRLGIRPLTPTDDVLPYQLGLRWGPTHPRRFRYEQRMALKSLLARGDRRAVGSAMYRTQRDFLAWARDQPGLAQRVAEATGLTMRAFWRVVRGRAATRAT